MSHVEIQQESHAFLGESEVREHLGEVDRQEALNGFDFDDDGMFNEKIDPIPGVYVNVAIGNRQ